MRRKGSAADVAELTGGEEPSQWVSGLGPAANVTLEGRKADGMTTQGVQAVSGCTDPPRFRLS